MNSLKDLYLLLEEENLTSPAHHTDKMAPAEEQPPSPTIKVGWSDARRYSPRASLANLSVSGVSLQSSAVSSTLADLRVALQDLSGELRQDRQGSQELTQQFAKAKASWEVERTELQSLITQVGGAPVRMPAACAAKRNIILEYREGDKRMKTLKVWRNLKQVRQTVVFNYYFKVANFCLPDALVAKKHLRSCGCVSSAQRE